MMEEELRQLLKDHGWSLYKRTQRERDFFYALKWKQGQIYLTSGTKLSELTREKVLEKIGVTSE